MLLIKILIALAIATLLCMIAHEIDCAIREGKDEE